MIADNEVSDKIPHDVLVNIELRQHDISPLHVRQPGSNTIDHPGGDHIIQPQEDQSIPQLDFDPNEGANVEDQVDQSRPSGISKQDSGNNGDVEVDDDFDFDDVEIKDQNSPKNRVASED